MALLNLFSGGALSYVSVFSLGIMPYITSSIILQMLQAVVPSLHELAREGEVGQTKITQYSRYLSWRRRSRDHLRPHDRRHAHCGRHADHVDW